MSDPFSVRHGYDAHLPDRVLVEQDSPRLRAAIWAIVSNDNKSQKHGYKELCRALGDLPDSNIWSDGASEEAAADILARISWIDTYEVLEELYASARLQSPGYSRSQIQAAVNKALARSGLAYEMRQGRFELFDPEAMALGIQGSESEALEYLSDEFGSVRKQYANAVKKLNGRPADFEGATADALNALEAVVAIVMGKEGKTLGDLSRQLFPEGEGYHESLRAAISKLYGYSSAVPGARHGRYAEPSIAAAETAMVLRIVGALISFVITDYKAGPTRG